MRTISHRFLFTLLCLGMVGGSQFLFAQNKSLSSNLKSTESRANDLFAKGAYREAVPLYEQLLARNANNQLASLRLAESFSLLNEQEQAVLWYEKVFATPAPVEPIHKLRYAQALSAVGQYAKAKNWYEQYSVAVPGDRRAKLQLEALAQPAKFYADSASYKIKRLKINTSQSEFGPAFYEQGLVYVAGREVKQPVKWVNTADQSQFLDLYYSKVNADGELSEAKKLQQELNSRYHEGPVAFFDGGKRIIFSQNLEQASKGKGALKRLGLFEAEKSGDGKRWVNITPLPFNSNAYSIAHPALNQQGDVLYFASDMPGGYGQSDLWMSRKQNGRWSAPQNLGPAVNTEGNEMFPYLLHNTLYFSSNGLGGLGGLDVFRVELGRDKAAPINLGAPVNSSKDDFGFILDANNSGYFSTNRIKENQDDLYWVRYIKATAAPAGNALATAKPISSRLKGRIVEKESGKALGGASIYIINEKTGEDLTLLADDKGYFAFDARLEDSYAIMGEKGAASVFVINIAPNELKGSDTLIRLEASTVSFPDNMVIETSLIDSLTHEPVVFAGAYLYEGDQEKQKDFTSLEGKAYFSGKKGNAYVVEVISINYADRKFHIPGRLQPVNDTLRVSIPLQKVRKNRSVVPGLIVHEESGKPLANAEIYLLNEVTGKEETLFADEKGEFRFEAAAGDTYMLMGEKDKMHVFLPNVTIQPGNFYKNNPLVLKASATHFTRKAVVEVLVVDSLSASPLRLTELSLQLKGETQKAYTTNQGKAYFQLPSDAEGTLLLAALKGYKAFTKKVTAPIGHDTIRVEIPLVKALPSPVVVQGYVYEKGSKQAVDQASIYLLNTRTGEELYLNSDAKGLFEVKVDVSAFYLIVAEKGTKSIFLSDHSFKQESPDAAVPQLLLAIEEPDFGKKRNEELTLAARIVDRESQEPVKFTFVKLYQAGELLEEAFTDEQGLLKLSLLKGRQYLLKTEKPQFADTSLYLSTVNKGDRLDLLVALNKRTPKHIAVKGNVVDQTSKTPMDNATIWVLNRHTGEQLQLKADKAGNFTFTADQQHSYTLVSESGTRSSNFVEYSPAAGEEKLQLVIQPEKSKDIVIAARVLNQETQEPVKVARLKLLEADQLTATTNTSLKGKAWLTSVAGKSYTLQVEAHNFIAKTMNVAPATLSHSDTLQLEIQLQPHMPVIVSQAGQFMNKDHQPLVNAKVYVINQKTGEEKKLLTNDKGIFSYESRTGDISSILAEKEGQKAYLTYVQSTGSADTLTLLAAAPAVGSVYAKVVAREKESLEPVKFLELTLSQHGESRQQFYTSFKGEVFFRAEPNQSYTLSGSHIQYGEVQQTFSLNEHEKDTVVIELLLEKQETLYTTLQVQVLDEVSKRPLANAAVAVLNETSGEEQLYLADERGLLPLKAKRTDSYSLRSPSDRYTATPLRGIKPLEKEGANSSPIQLFFRSNKAKATTTLPAGSYNVIEIAGGNKQLFVAAGGVLYEYQLTQDHVVLRSQSQLYILSEQVGENAGESLLKDFKSYVDTSAIEATTLIRNVYYEFDKTALNGAAREELKKIAALMKTYPEVDLKINAFTDSRGPARYNLQLSKLRAEAAKAYLLSLGIASNRISSEGFGESQLVKPCPKPQDCSPSDHKANRRGEFILNLRE